jgi:nucleotide-binding universal stress UspA family protein
MKIQDIYVATDLSEVSASAARWAQNAKTTFGAQVTVAHVVEVSVSNWFSSAMDTFEDHQRIEKAKENIRTWYKDATGHLPDFVDIRMGSPASQLSEIVGDDGNKSMIVMARSGRGSVSKFFLGSTVARVAAMPPCPLVIVHPEHESLEPNKAIIVGTDFSPNGNAAVEAAADFAKELGSALHIVHANPTPPILVFDGADVPIESMQASAKLWSSAAMQDLMNKLSPTAGPNLTAEISGDLPAVALANAVKSRSAGLMFVGHSGESELMQRVLGSTAQRCLTEMPCTLIILPRNK